MRTFKKRLSLLLIMAITLTMSMGLFTVAFAEDETNEIVLIVRDETADPVIEKAYTQEMLEALAKDRLSYSGRNNGDSCKILTGVKGVLLVDLFANAGITNYQDKSVYMDCDKPASLNGDILFATRYYYPDLKDLNAVTGPIDKVLADSQKVEVKPCFGLEVPGQTDTKVLFGQENPSDRNWPCCYDAITGLYVREKNTDIGKYDEPVATVKDGSLVVRGTTVGFTVKPTDKKCGFIYYTTDGSEPDAYNSTVYNFCPAAVGVEKNTNPITISKKGTTTVKAYTTAIGKGSSDVVTYKYTVNEPTSVTLDTKYYTYTGKTITPKIKTVKAGELTIPKSGYTVKGSVSTGVKKAVVTGTGEYTGSVNVYYHIRPKKGCIRSVKAGKNKLTVRWYKRYGSITKYQIAYKKAGTSTWHYKYVSPKYTSCTLTKLSKNKEYYVKVRAYTRNTYGTAYGLYSDVKTKKTN